MSKHAKAKSKAKTIAKTTAKATPVAHEEPVVETPVEEVEPLDAADAADAAEATEAEKEREKFKLEFYGSDILRMQAPEVMKFADTVADEWIHDGNFNDIPLPSPVAQALVAQGLRKAKEVEKKLDEKGVFLMARMGVDYVKSKIKK